MAAYVSPAGAHAGSAGTFIAAAANFVVMAPGANIGAVSPVEAGGRKIPGSLAPKISEDLRAFIRSIAEARGRNVDASGRHRLEGYRRTRRTRPCASASLT